MELNIYYVKLLMTRTMNVYDQPLQNAKIQLKRQKSEDFANLHQIHNQRPVQRLNGHFPTNQNTPSISTISPPRQTPENSISSPPPTFNVPCAPCARNTQ